MSKYKLTNLLNEYIGGGRIGTLKTSYRDLVDRMEELEKSDEVIVRELSGPSGDGKVNREFEVVARDSAVPGGNKQERGFTIYDYKFGFDPGSMDHSEEEYDFSVGGNDIDLARKLIGDIEPFGIGENGHVEDFADEIAENRREKNPEGMGQLYVQPAVQREVKFHLDAYDKGDIDVDDMIQAIEDIIFGHVKAPGMREDLFSKDGDNEDNVDNIDQVASPSAKGKGYSSAVDAERSESGKEQDNVTQTTKPMYKESLKLSKMAEGMYIDHDDFMDEIYVARAKEIAPILKGVDMDIIVDFVKTHRQDIRGASDEEIRDEFEEFRSVNYDYIDEDLKNQFKRFM